MSPFNTTSSAESVPSGGNQLLEPGFMLGGKYRVDRLLARGGMGAVYEATHVLSDKRVAIKWMLPGSAAERFAREARATGRIEHPNIIDLYDVGSERGAPYLVMELLQGETLAALLHRQRPSLREAIRIVSLAAKGIAAAHERGVIHRDLKPENIFLCASDDAGPPHVKVLDFGISKLRVPDVSLNSALTNSGTLLGTPYYMPPEQLREPDGVDERADIYALGVILYECLTGQKPFASTNYNVLILHITTARALPAHQVAASIPPALSAIVERAMAQAPEGRFSHADELVQALRPYLDRPSDDASGSRLLTSGAPRPSRWALLPRGLRWSLAAGACALLALSFATLRHDEASARASTTTVRGAPAQLREPAQLYVQVPALEVLVPSELAMEEPKSSAPVLATAASASAAESVAPRAESTRKSHVRRVRSVARPKRAKIAPPPVAPERDWAGPIRERDLL